MYSLRLLNMGGNPVTAEKSTERCVRHYVRHLSTLDGITVPDSQHPQTTEFQKMCLQQAEAHDKLWNAYVHGLRYCDSFFLRCICACRCLKCPCGNIAF